MFADSLLEPSWAQYSRRSWTTLTSFGLQAVVLGLLLLFSLLGGVGMPVARTVSTPVILGRSAPPPTGAAHVNPGTGIRLIPVTGRLMSPRSIPRAIPPGDGPVDPIGIGGDRIGDIGPSALGPSDIPFPVTGTRVMPVPAPVPSRPTFRTSQMLQGMLVHKVEPVYPAMAKIAHVQGAVVLAAIISKEGAIEHLQLMSGHPLLVPAAIDAVSRWRYKPYILNGDAIEVETQITVNFILGN